MPGSAPDFREHIYQHMLQYGSDIEILDVGAGEGTYANLLKWRPVNDVLYPRIDAIEIHTPYIKKYNLMGKYRRVYRGDARLIIDELPTYDVIILGAILEHMKRSEAQRLLESCIQRARYEVLVTVPFETPQGAVNGNIWETHIQDDLTPALMASHFPALVPQMVNAKRGFYIARGTHAR